MTRDLEGLTLSFRLEKGPYAYIFFLGIMWVLFNNFPIIMIFALTSQVFLIEILFFELFSLPGLVMVYYSLVMMLDTITLRAVRGSLTINRKPLPWFGKEISTAQIKQVMVHSDMVTRSTYRGYRTVYSVRALLNDGRQIKMIGGLQSLEVAESIEKGLETYWNIRDQRSVDETVAVATRRVEVKGPPSDVDGVRSFGGTTLLRMSQMGNVYSGMEVFDATGKKVGSLVRTKFLGFNRNMIYLAIFLGVMGSAILFLSVSGEGTTNGPIFLIVIVFAVIFLMGALITGTRVYRSDQGSYSYVMKNKLTTSSGPHIICQDPISKKIHFTRQRGTISFTDGTICYDSIGISYNGRGGSSVIRPINSMVSVIIYKELINGMFDHPILSVRDVSTPSKRTAEIVVDENHLGQARTDQLVGYAVQMFLWCKMNPSMVVYRQR